MGTAYRVVVTPRAEADLKIAYRFIRRAAPDAARTWLEGARRTIRALEKLPERGRLAPESTSFHEPVREILYGRGNRGTYRILYTVTDKPDKEVFVLHVRHGAMLPSELSPADLF